MKRGARGMGRVFKRGGVWWIAYWDRAARKERREAGGAKRRAAVDLLKKRHEEMAAGRTFKEARSVLLSDLRALIEADYMLNGRRSSARVSQSWAHLAGHFGKDEPAVQIKAARLAAYVQARTADGATAGTIKVELAALKRAFNLARKAGTLLANEVPAAWPTIRGGRPRAGFLERDEHERLRAALPADEGDVAEFLYWTGWRKSEALGLRWSNVDQVAGVIRIETTKSGEPRTLPYAALPALASLIQQRKAVTDAVQKARGLIVTSVFHRNGEPIRYFRRSWITACKKAGLSGRIPHDYRRSAARNLSRAGVPERVIMQLCGWKTRSVFDRYRIVAERELAEGLARLAAAPPIARAPKVVSIAE